MGDVVAERVVPVAGQSEPLLASLLSRAML
jgi:hypothetical protein